MYGYIYETRNLLNDRIYIGQHKSEQYDSTYYGSGKVLNLAIKKYGIENFSNRLLIPANSKQELDELEIKTIEEYATKYGQKLYNLAKGGNGGDVFAYADEDSKKAFVDKMTDINKQRCQSADFKEKISQAGKLRYSNTAEREKQSKRVHEYWESEEARRRHSETIKESYLRYPKDATYLQKPCVLVINDVSYDFDTRKELIQYLKDNYNFTLSHKLFKHLTATMQSYKPFHKRFKCLEGMTIYYK